MKWLIFTCDRLLLTFGIGFVTFGARSALGHLLLNQIITVVPLTLIYIHVVEAAGFVLMFVAPFKLLNIVFINKYNVFVSSDSIELWIISDLGQSKSLCRTFSQLFFSAVDIDKFDMSVFLWITEAWTDLIKSLVNLISSKGCQMLIAINESFFFILPQFNSCNFPHFVYEKSHLNRCVKNRCLSVNILGKSFI